jgi:TRAP-type C4-dicarboxylate transport system permease small subunit
MTPDQPLRWLRRAEESLGVALLCLIFLSIALQVVARLLFRSPPFWTEELARYLFVWVVCIGSAEVVRAQGHITMDILATLFGARVWSVLQVGLNTMIAAVLIVLVWYGTLGAMRAARVESIALGVPEAFLFGALPVGAALMALRMVLLIAADITDLRRGTAETRLGGNW